MTGKDCTKCGDWKPYDEFPKRAAMKDGYDSWCKVCRARVRLERYHTNKEAGIDENAERKAYHKAYRNRPEVKERNKRYQKEYKPEYRQTAQGKAVRAAWVKKNYENDPRFKIKRRIGGAMSDSLRRKTLGKNTKAGRHWETLVGYTVDDLMAHLESQFRDGMSWDNYGLDGWTIDHILPVAIWSFETPDDPEFKQCWALCNLQPLWHELNQRKAARV